MFLLYLAYVELLLATANGMPIKLTGGSIGGAGVCMSDSSSFSEMFHNIPLFFQTFSDVLRHYAT